jgi:hypothetical protein
MKMKEIITRDFMKILLISFLMTMILPLLLLLGIIGISLINHVPPEQYDFSLYSGHVVRVDIVDWSSEDSFVHPQGSDDYRIILTLDESQYETLLTSLSSLDFYQKGPGDPPGFFGRCILITLDDDSYRVIGRYGYAQYNQESTRLSRYTNLWRYIRDRDFEELFEPYLGR